MPESEGITMRFLMSLALMLLASSAFAADVLYISVAEEKRIAVYQINSMSGELSKIGDVATTRRPDDSPAEDP
jgi:hypothetical protein